MSMRNRRPKSLHHKENSPLSSLTFLEVSAASAVMCNVVSVTHALELVPFSGMEDFVVRDLLHLFRAHTDLKEEDLPAIPPSESTGHIAIPAGPAAWAAYDLFRRGLVDCAKRAYLKVAEEPMPSEILTRLGQERRDIALAMGNYHRARKGCAKNGDEKPPPAQRPQGPTEAEQDFIDALKEFWDGCEAHRKRALEAWTELKRENPRGGRFRGSADRTGYLLPTINTVALEKEVGDLVSAWQFALFKTC